MNRQRLSRASLKITRHGHQPQDSHFTVEVWNPFASAYQTANSVEDGVRRVGELADLIGRMWVQRHPKRDVLVDVPDLAATDGAIWAEFRINATTLRSYDIRYDARPEWARTTSLTQAVATIRSRVGCPITIAGEW